MILKRLDLLNEQEINFLSNLYLEAFPPEERREISVMLDLAEEEANKFTILLVLEETKYIGFFNYWTFNEFNFAEHFAISSDFRNGGYGSKVMNLFMENSKRPIILEVEPPVTEIAKRRIGFYERLGFTILDVDYQQPSYTGDGTMYHMKLMSDGTIDFSEKSKEIIHKIHSIAYKR